MTDRIAELRALHQASKDARDRWRKDIDDSELYEAHVDAADMLNVSVLNSFVALLDCADALGALGVIGGGYCFCSRGRDPDKAEHEPECQLARAGLLALNGGK